MAKSAPPILLPRGACTTRLLQYNHNQRRIAHNGNKLESWAEHVAEFFTPEAPYRVCVSNYGYRQNARAAFPQRFWKCQMCSCLTGCGLEYSVVCLPRMLQVMHDSGMREELMYLDAPIESIDANGQVALSGNVVFEAVFDNLRVVRYGILYVTFNEKLQISCWEFCVHTHEQLLSRKQVFKELMPLLQLAGETEEQMRKGVVTEKIMENTCQTIVERIKWMCEKLCSTNINDLGYEKRLMRCMQITDALDIMKELMDDCNANNMGPIAALNAYEKNMSTSWS